MWRRGGGGGRKEFVWEPRFVVFAHRGATLQEFNVEAGTRGMASLRDAGNTMLRECVVYVNGQARMLARR